MTARGTAAKAKRVRTTKSPSRTAAKPRTLGAQLAEARDAAGGDRRDPARHQPVADGCATGVRDHRRPRIAPLRRKFQHLLQVRRRADPSRCTAPHEARRRRRIPRGVPLSRQVVGAAPSAPFSPAALFTSPTSFEIPSTSTTTRRNPPASAASCRYRCCATDIPLERSAYSEMRQSLSPIHRSTC